MRIGTNAALGMAFVALLGCERDPRVAVCPELAAGDLVVSEIRGDQSGSDDELGEWIELYNASSQPVDLKGVAVVVQRLDGGDNARLVFRRDVTIEAGGYAVLGRFFDLPELLPAYVSYGYSEDFDKSLYDTGAIEIYACGTLTDQLIYRNLPSTGTYAFDGAANPDATDNDDADRWCTDDVSGAPLASGTPGERNPACPE